MNLTSFIRTKDVQRKRLLKYHIFVGMIKTDYLDIIISNLEGLPEQQELEGEGKIWILKPGEDTNRGNGIVVSSSLPEIIETINSLKGESGNS